MAHEEDLEAGRAALRGGRWEAAVQAFEASLAARESVDALDGLGEALWWLCEARASVRYRERAFVKSRQAGDIVRACMTAIDLSISYLLNLGNIAASRGWLARAERLMADTDPAPVQGWLWLMQAFLSEDPDRARELLARAMDSARATGDVDLELVALSDLGLALVTAGEAEKGVTLLDEAMAGALAGEYRRKETVVYTSCNMLQACSLLGDLERASQWCQVADDFMRDYSSPFLFARCRVHYGNVLVAKGRWVQAEETLQAVLQMPEDVGPGPHEEALARLADLRVRQGRLEEAHALQDVSRDPAAATLPRAALHLSRDEPVPAIALLERRLEAGREGGNEIARVLGMLVEAHIARGDLEAGRMAVRRLEAFAESPPGTYAEALAFLASARLAAARSHPEEAIPRLEGALERFARLDLPLETARVRLELARTLAPAHPAPAVTEARTALAVFEQLGASRDGDAAAALLRSLGVPARMGPKHVGVLTKREHEVLELVALGLSNPEIAQRLFISRKTSAHHVSNVLAKLGLRNRAEAVAYAARTSRQRTEKQ